MGFLFQIKREDSVVYCSHLFISFLSCIKRVGPRALGMYSRVVHIHAGLVLTEAHYPTSTHCQLTQSY